MIVPASESRARIDFGRSAALPCSRIRIDNMLGHRMQWPEPALELGNACRYCRFRPAGLISPRSTKPNNSAAVTGDRHTFNRGSQEGKCHPPQRGPGQDQEGSARDAASRTGNQPQFRRPPRQGGPQDRLRPPRPVRPDPRRWRTPRPRIADPEPPARENGSPVDAALRHQLRTQKRQYDNDTAALKAEIRSLKEQLAAAHGEILRLRSTTTTT